MADKLKSVSTYIVLVLVIGIFIYLITNYVSGLQSNPNASLSESSQVYANEITGGNKTFGVNTTVYGEDVGKASDLGGADNKNDFSLDFSFGDKSGNKLERTVYVATNIPEFLLMDVFRLLPLQWLADLLDWALGIFLFVAFVNWIRSGDK
jgi:hypothetical protein